MTATHFTVAYWCVLIASMLPYLCAGIAKWGTFRVPRSQGGYDNHNPRAWLAGQSDWRARANAAQSNSFEGLPFFIGAVVIAHQLGASQAMTDILAFAYVFIRIVYIMTYVADAATVRSVMWALGIAVNAGILFVGFR